VSGGALFLYDIDGTVLSSAGAGRRALDLAFEALYGVAGAFDRVSFGGATDPGITERAHRLAGLPFGPRSAEVLREAYLARLPEVLESMREVMVLHPGVREALTATAGVGVNGLLTGNWRGGARLKLGCFDLWEAFEVGAFGDDSGDRDDLVPVAERRARGLGLDFGRTVVIGDTPADVACARAGGAIAVAVLTGWSTAEALEAAEPDLLVEDLERGLPALLEVAAGL